MKKVVVISLGGSLIVPEKMDARFLAGFVRTLRALRRTHKFVIVCGGGSVARRYIAALREEGKSEKELALAGIRATRMNAMLVMQMFGKVANDRLPLDMVEVRNNLPKNDVVICGALRYAPHSTSDGTAAKLAHFLKADFINMTNVKGLYDKNPSEYKDARFIPHESWKDFEKRALKLKFKAAQHFVLDQSAAVMIRKHKIVTYILGADLKNLARAIKGEKFVGTTISG